MSKQLRDAPTREWTREHAGFWDQAVEGSSALKVALSRLDDDEIAQTLGIHTGCLYKDIKEFYDYLCPVKTLKAALDLGFPSPVAVLSFSSYGGVRILQGPDGCSYPLQAARASSQVIRTPTILPGPHSTICWNLPIPGTPWSKRGNG